MTTRRRASGFTMLEVLISMIVIAFGLLGIAGLQIFALKNNQSAGYRSVATALAYDMVDRMKANPIGAENGSYNLNGGRRVDSCLSGGCNPDELAANDVFEWNALVTAQLPGASAVVCRDNAADNGTSSTDPKCTPGATAQYAIKIWWVDDRNATATPGRFSTHFEQ